MNGHATSFFEPKGKAIDCGRPVRVTIIGAGVCGIALYIRLLQHVPNAKITIFEKNPEAGGTWFENRYPGVACDIPSHVYQYSFEPNPDWSKLFSPGAEILTYVQGVAQKYGVSKKIQYNSRVSKAVWDEQSSTWDLEIEDTNSGEKRSVTSEVVISAVGLLNNWKWPDVEGLHDFQGKLLHSAKWDTKWDYEGKVVALLGCGSSAIQILPCLQKKCPSVVNFVRGGTWISQPFGSTLTESTIAKGNELNNYSYTEEERARFRNDHEHYQNLRRQLECFTNKDFPCLFPGTKEELEGTEKIKRVMQEALASRPGVYEALEPRFTPGCRRLTPGPGYLEALTKDNVSLVKTPITKVVSDGVITTDGKHWKVDAIACATGFDSSHIPRFPILGRDGQSLAELWKKRAAAYMSHSVPGFPNYFVVGGPNSATGGGSLLLILESVLNYVIKAVQKISREHILAMEVKESASTAWIMHLDQYFPGTVHVDQCTSWYKVNGKIIGLWPGSATHAMKALEHPRWEDYEYEYDEANGASELGWIGNGWTVADVERGDVGYYIDHADIPPVPTADILSRQP